MPRKHKHKYESWNCPECGVPSHVCKTCGEPFEFDHIPTDEELYSLTEKIITTEEELDDYDNTWKYLLIQRQYKC